MNRRFFTLILGCSFLCFPTIFSQENETDPLIICLLADPQLIMVPETPEYIDYAMHDISLMDHDFIAVLGRDLAQNRASYYDDYQKTVLDQAIRPVFSLAGNGDVGAGLSAYKKATGLPLFYSFYGRGIRFIFLSTTRFTGEHNHICHLGYEQLRWLRQELKSDTVSTTIIFSHPPLYETTWHSEERDHLSPPGSMYLLESLELKEMFRIYNNVKIFAHGHLHHQYGEIDESGRGNYHLDRNLLHISVGATANNRGSSFLILDKDKITVKVRDHEHKAWLDKFEYTMNISTTLNEKRENFDLVRESIKVQALEQTKNNK